MEKHSHIIRLREREVTYFPVDPKAAPQPPVLQQQAEEEPPWADRVWRRWVKPFVWHFWWMCFWLAWLVFVLRAGIYLIKIGG